MYHSVIIQESLKDKEVLKNYKILRTKVTSTWHLQIAEIPAPERAIPEIQKAMVENQPYYFHIFDEGKNLIIVFKDKYFKIDPNDKSTWQEVTEYGITKLNIPADQLDFFPQKISDETAWLHKK